MCDCLSGRRGLSVAPLHDPRHTLARLHQLLLFVDGHISSSDLLVHGSAKFEFYLFPPFSAALSWGVVSAFQTLKKRHYREQTNSLPLTHSVCVLEGGLPAWLGLGLEIDSSSVPQEEALQGRTAAASAVAAAAVAAEVAAVVGDAAAAAHPSAFKYHAHKDTHKVGL